MLEKQNEMVWFLTTLSREVWQERIRQKEMFPTEECQMPDGTAESGGRQTYMSMAKVACDRAQREGVLTHAHIFEEETCEVLAEKDPIKLRKELIEVMAVCAKWIADIDSRK